MKPAAHPSTLPVEIIAHRGASYDAPENTLAAVKLGWKQGADAVEVDIQCSKDNRIIVIHDDDTLRIGGFDGRVSDQLFADLRRLEAGAWKGAAWAGERFPSLEEVIATVPVGKRLFVEVKCGPAFLPEFQAVLERSARSPAQVVPIGFSASTMALVKEAFPAHEVCLVAEFAKEEKTGRWRTGAEQLIAEAKAAGLDGLDVDGYGPVTGEFVRQVKEAGLHLYVWTVDSPARARELIAAGLDGITTNRPGWLRQELGG